jgi:exonuclease SbcC
MIIRRIRLVNFRKYSELELEFPEGLIGIVGRNGAGKTTILEAVGFALYGASASRSKGKGIRRDGCSQNENCVVELDFALGGNSYSIVRELRGTNELQTAKMYTGDEELIAHQARGIEAKARQLLGLDYQTFIRSIFARQKELALLSDERPEERRRAIRRMMGIERIERAYKLAREDKHAKEEFIKGAQTTVADLEVKAKELEQLQPQIEKERERLAAAEGEVEQGKKLERIAEQALSVQEEKRKKFTEIDKKLSTSRAHLSGAERHEDELTDELGQAKGSRRRLRKLRPELAAYEKTSKEKERLDRAEGVFKERNALANEIATLAREIKQRTEELGSRQAELRQFEGLDRQIKATAARIQKAEKELKEKEGDLRKARSALDQKLGLLRQLADNVKRVRKEGAKGECPTCLRPLGDNFSEIMAHFAEEKSALIDSQSELQEQVSGLEKTKSVADRELRASTKERQQLLRQQGNRKALQVGLKAIRKELQSDKATMQKKQKRLVVLNRTPYDPESHRRVGANLKALSKTYAEAIELGRDASRIPSLQNGLEQVRAQIAGLIREIKAGESSLKKIAFSPSAHEKAKLAHDQAVTRWQELETHAGHVREGLAILNDRSTRLDAEIKEKTKLKKQIEAEEEAIRYLAQLEYILKEFQADLISRIRPLIAQRASMLLDQVTEGRYPQVELDEDYTISIVDDGVGYPIKRYSGGEEDLINLCLRIAISQIIAEQMSGSGSGLIALDEVFGSQDRERRERLIRAMLSLTPFFRQILFITHVEDLQERVPNLLQVSENQDRTASAQWLN